MRASNLPVRAALLLAAGATLATVAILGTLWAMGALASQEETRQEEIAEKGAQVMPFDLEETTPHLREDADRRAAEGGG